MQISFWKVVVIILVCIVGSVVALPNFVDKNYSFLPKERINLGLDLRGGSYLLLKVDFDSYLKDQLEVNADMLRRELRKNQIGYSNLSIKTWLETFEIILFNSCSSPPLASDTIFKYWSLFLFVEIL